MQSGVTGRFLRHVLSRRLLKDALSPRLFGRKSRLHGYDLVHPEATAKAASNYIVRLLTEHLLPPTYTMFRRILRQGSIVSASRRTHSRAGTYSTISVPWLAASGFALLFDLESKRGQAAPAAADQARQAASADNTSIPGML